MADNLLAEVVLTSKLRIVLTVIFVIAVFFIRYAMRFSFAAIPVFSLLLIFLFSNILFSILEKNKKFSGPSLLRGLLALRVFLDITLIGIAVYYTGWVISPIIIFFLLPIIILIFAFRNLLWGFLGSLYIIAIYSTIALLINAKLVPMPSQLFYPASLGSVVIGIFFFAITIMIVPFLIIPMVRLLEVKEAQAAQVRFTFTQTNADLITKIKELGTLNTIMIQRELEMVEIKKEIAGLERNNKG